MGNMKHQLIEDLFQLCLNSSSSVISPAGTFLHLPKHSRDNIIKEKIVKIINNHTEELYCAHVTDRDLREKLFGVVGPTLSFIQCFMMKHKTVTERERERENISTIASTTVPIPISVELTQVIGSEETVWSPALGIKGQLDVTTMVQVNDNSSPMKLSCKCPIEIKTGEWKPSVAVSHRAQVLSLSLFCVIIF